MHQGQLARRAAVARNTIIEFERSKRAISAGCMDAIQRALESAGVIFVEENGEGPGVRLKKSAK
jgi:hypothetical protein